MHAPAGPVHGFYHRCNRAVDAPVQAALDIKYLPSKVGHQGSVMLIAVRLFCNDQKGGSMGSNNGWSLASAAPQMQAPAQAVPRPPSAAEREMEDRMANINSAWGSRI